jgi:hypothetical protein
MYGTHLTWFQRFLQRFQITPVQMAKAELKDAELAALQSVSMAEYADLRMQTHKLTADYHEGRAERLREYLKNHDRDEDEERPRVSIVQAMFPGEHHPGY